MENPIKIINRILFWGSNLLIFLLPLFFLPITTDFFDFNKNTLLILLTGILTLAWIIKMALNGKVEFRYTIFNLPLLVILVAFIAAPFIVSSNRSEALLNPLGTITIIAFSLFYLIITNNFTRESIRPLTINLSLSGTLIGLISIYQFLGLGQSLSGLTWLKQPTFSPAGGLLPAAAILVPTLIILIGITIKKIKTTADASLGFVILSIIITSGGLALNLYQLFTTAKPVLLDIPTSWAIAIEGLKGNPLLGIGPSDYLSGFLRFRPINFNNTLFWNIKFALAGNYYLQILTTVGLLGLSGFIWLIINSLKSAKTLLKDNLDTKIIFAGLISILIILALIPASLSLIFLLYLLLAMTALKLPERQLSETSRVLPIFLLIPTIVGVGVSFFYLQQNWRAEYFFKLSLDAFARNEGSVTYQNQVTAISLNPEKALYRIAHSQTDLAIANSLASNKDLSDQDRTTITSLIEEAIREAKYAVTLDQNSSTNWENLATVYRQLINLAQGADQWCVASYQRAIILDPTNPNLSLSLGGVYYGLKNYDEAIRWFQRAVDVKPDLANTHYNLASAYREKKDYARGAIEMENVVKLVDTNSGDYQKAIDELNDLKKKLSETNPTPAPEVKSPETLSQPSPIPSPILSPTISLPEESQPPQPISEEITPATP